MPGTVGVIMVSTGVISVLMELSLWKANSRDPHLSDLTSEAMYHSG